MKAADKEYEESLAYIREKLAQPPAEVDRWLNGMVDSWIANPRASGRRKKAHVKV